MPPTIIDKLRREPALVAAVVLAVIQAVALPDAWAKVVMAILALAAGGAVRSQVTPTVTAIEQTAQATTNVALAVAKNLDAATAGAVGEITGQAARIVDDALEETRTSR